MSAADRLHAGTDALVSLDLEEVVGRVALMERSDRKYFVDEERLAEFLQLVGHDFGVLEIDGLRLMSYHSTYYDTADLVTYRDHLKGRRRRYKIRLRSYIDTGTNFLEVKHKGLRASTSKSRVEYRGDLELSGPPPVLGQNGHDYVSGVLRHVYRHGLPGPLEPSYSTINRRATLVSLVDDARVTVDVDLKLADHSGADTGFGMLPEFAMIETKSARGRSVADRALRSLGVRPVKVSKYCAAVAMHRPDLPSSPWRRIIRTYFSSALAV